MNNNGVANKTTKPKKKMGRPLVEIDKKVFEKLCEKMNTEEDIAYYFDCSVDTINRWCGKNYQDEDGKPMTFAEVYKKTAAKGRASLRRMMFQSAENGNVTMQIFLAKSILGLREGVQVDVATDGVQIYIPDNGRQRKE